MEGEIMKEIIQPEEGLSGRISINLIESWDEYTSILSTTRGKPVTVSILLDFLMSDRIFRNLSRRLPVIAFENGEVYRVIVLDDVQCVIPWTIQEESWMSALLVS